MLSYASIHRLSADQRFLMRQSSKLSSNFVLRPKKVEGPTSLTKPESNGFKGLLSRNTSANYVTTSSRRKKLATCFNWNQIKNPELELKLRKKWIQENKSNDVNRFKEANSNNTKDRNENIEELKNSLPEMTSDFKKVYGSPIFKSSLHSKSRKPASASNFQPIVTGIRLRSHSEVTKLCFSINFIVKNYVL